MKFNVKQAPTEQEISRVRGHLFAYNDLYMGSLNNECFVLDILSDDNTLLAGTVARIRGDWMTIDYLTVDEKVRGLGYGKGLMQELENIAKRYHCKQLHLETASFQARPLYEKLGFVVEHTFENFPTQGMSRYIMTKNLVA